MNIQVQTWVKKLTFLTYGIGYKKKHQQAAPEEWIHFQDAKNNVTEISLPAEQLPRLR